MKNKLLLSIILLCSLYSVAQQREIKIIGKVVDQETNEPLEYATIAFLNAGNNQIVTGGITGTDGNFAIKVPPGIYAITVEYISFKTKKLDNQRLFKDSNLGTIRLALDTETLEDVVVIAEKTTVEIKLDKKIYNVGKDLTVSGGTVSDVLDNVPSVSVDVEGNVALRGNDNVRILINGRPSGLVGLNSTEALRQLPAESIERVEVITSPSARYDAEGTAGILNIILRRSKLQGLNGAITTTTGYPFQVGFSGNVNYRTGDFNFFTTSGYNHREIPGNAFSSTRFFNEDASPADDTFLVEERDFDRIRRGITTNTGIEWYINPSSSLTGSFLYRSGDNERTTTNIITEPDSFGNITSSSVRLDPEEEADFTRQYAVNYSKSFDDNGHTLTADFQVENSSEDEQSRITQDNIAGIEIVSTLEKQDNILLQADYVKPMGQNGQFELGYRGTFNELKTDYFVGREIDEILTTNNDLSNNLLYREYVNAAYTQYGNKIGKKLSFLLGLRMEDTRIIIDQQTINDFNRKNYTDFFPTINLNYKISDKENITLGYNRRIRRPRSRFLNPFPSRSSATNLFQGNPDLDPSYSNVFDLGYLNRLKKVTINSSVYYNRTTQDIAFVSEPTGDFEIINEVDNDSVQVIRRRPINLANEDRFGFEFTITYNPSRKWKVNGNFNAFQQIIRGENNGESLDAENFSWFARLNNKFMLPGKVDWQTILFYRGPNENAQNRNKGILSVNLAFSKDLFKEKASITFNVSDLFNSRKRQSVSTTRAFVSDSDFQWRERSFTFAFTYRFNQKKKRQRSQRGFNGDEEFEG